MRYLVIHLDDKDSLSIKYIWACMRIKVLNNVKLHPTVLFHNISLYMQKIRYFRVYYKSLEHVFSSNISTRLGYFLMLLQYKLIAINVHITCICHLTAKHHNTCTYKPWKEVVNIWSNPIQSIKMKTFVQWKICYFYQIAFQIWYIDIWTIRNTFCILPNARQH